MHGNRTEKIGTKCVRYCFLGTLTVTERRPLIVKIWPAVLNVSKIGTFSLFNEPEKSKGRSRKLPWKERESP